MSTSLKFITSNDSPIFEPWVKNRDAAYKELDSLNKLIFLLDQSVIVSYISKCFGTFDPSSSVVYDTGALYLITSYKNDFIIPEITTLKADPEITKTQMYTDILDQIDSLLGISTFRVDSKLCIGLLESARDYIRAFDISFYRPYLLFLEKSLTEAWLDEKDIHEANNFSVLDSVSIPGLSISDSSILVVSYDQRFSSYTYNAKQHAELDKVLNIGSSSILSFLFGYDWSTWTLNGLLGALAGMCLELDANAIPCGSMAWMYYFLYRKIFGWTPHATTVANSLGLSPEIVSSRRCVLSFVSAVRSRYKVAIDDVSLIEKILATDSNDDTDNLHKYLTAKDASDISVEMYTAFKKSIFGTFEELDFMKSKKQSLNKLIALRARFNKEVSTSLSKATSLGDLDAYLKDTTFNLYAAIEAGKRMTKAKNAAGGYFDADTGQDTDESSDNTEEDTVKPESPDSDDNNPNSEPVTAPGGDNDEMLEDGDTHTQEPLPVVSDKRGVQLALSTGESTDTVLYRFELKAYVETLLANPPKYLDVQTISYLKRLLAFWWNCLSVQTLYDVLNSMVKVPKDYRIKKVKVS